MSRRWLLAALLLCACSVALLLATADGAHRRHASKPKVKRQHNTVVVTNNNGLNQGIDFRPPNPVREMLDEHYRKKAEERLEKREADERARKDARDLNEQSWKRQSAEILAGVDSSNKKPASTAAAASSKASANPTAGPKQLADSTATPAGQQLPVTPTPQQQQQQQAAAQRQLQEEAARDEEAMAPKKNVLEDEGANMGEEPELKDLPPPAEPPSLDNLAGENLENPSKDSGQTEQQQQQQQQATQEGGQAEQEQQQSEQSAQEQAPKKKKKQKNKNKKKQHQQQEGGDQSTSTAQQQSESQSAGGEHEETPEQQREPFLGTFSLPELPPELHQQPPPPGTVWQKPNAQWQPVQDNLPDPQAA